MISKKHCSSWLENKKINPFTGKRLDTKESVYKKLEQHCTKEKEKCLQWLEKKNINPFSGRSIKINGPTYRKLERKCMYYRIKEPGKIDLGDCYNTEDPLTLKLLSSFKHKDEITKIGTGRKRNCFSTKALYEDCIDRISRNKLCSNPITGQFFTQKDMNELMKNERSMKKRKAVK